MNKLSKPKITDRREKPITVKGTKISNQDISLQPKTDTIFKKGGVVSKGQGIVIKRKTTKNY
jgi:hypothetical protein